MNWPTKMSVLSLAAIAIGACTVQGRTRAYVEPQEDTVEITSAPIATVSYESYPHTVYEGRTVYWVDGRWGYPRAGRWVYYRSEPPPLARYRTTVEVAPPAPRYEHRQPEAPPATRTR